MKAETVWAVIVCVAAGVLLALGLFAFLIEPRGATKPRGFVMMTLPDREVIAVSECPFWWGPLPWVTTLSNAEVTGVQYEFVRVATYGGVIFAEARTEGYAIPAHCGVAYQ